MNFVSYFFMGVVAVCSLYSCAPKIKQAKVTHIVVRSANTNKLLKGVEISVVDTRAMKPTSFKLGQTDELGYFQINWKKTKYSGPDTNLAVVYSIEVVGEETSYVSADTMRLFKYFKLLDLYLPTQNELLDKAVVVKPVADMHYHLSTRVHNLFGDKLYSVENRRNNSVPSNLNAYQDIRKIRVLYNGKWRRPYLGRLDLGKSNPSTRTLDRRGRMTALLDQKWLRPRHSKGSNKLRQYTQATHPHLVHGEVKLAYNVITPFEHGLANTGGKRFAHKVFVTQSSPKWLKILGGKGHVTQWENFLWEWNYNKRQAGFYNHYKWASLTDGKQLKDESPYIVHVIEGAHALQDDLFPARLDYNIANRTPKESWQLFTDISQVGVLDSLNEYGDPYHGLLKHLRLQVTDRSLDELEIIGKLNKPKEGISYREWLDIRPQFRRKINGFVDSLLTLELTDNVQKIKQNKNGNPPIAMVTIAHLSYNGMFGHAPNLNGGAFITKLFARKNYNLKVSDFKGYKKQWGDAFFAIPGINKFGKTVIDSLVSEREGYHRILIDLKHSDYMTREYFYDSIMYQVNVEKGVVDTIPPICSHCAVTGLPSSYFSPLVDEFSLLNSFSTTTFYPFGINLYDEEIMQICQNGGIVGIPLFQNVLGGNINKKQKRNFKIQDTIINYNEKQNLRRAKEIKKYLKYLYNNDSPLLHAALGYTKNDMKVSDPERIFEITTEDFLSAEPFLQNLFYLVDHSGYNATDIDKAWQHICIGSDLDGLIDPIDIVPTASVYPHFRSRLTQFIPLFLNYRKEITSTDKKSYHSYPFYFSETGISLEKAMDQLFYESLKDFTRKHMLKNVK